MPGIAADYVFVHSSLREAFLQACSQTVEQFFGKEPRTSPDLGRIVSERHTQRLKNIIDDHRAEVALGGDVDVEAKWVSPTILDLKTGPHGKAMEEEIFGPVSTRTHSTHTATVALPIPRSLLSPLCVCQVLPVLPYDDLAYVLRYINSHPKPLALYLFSPSSSVVQRVLKETSSGGVSINDTVMHIVNKDLPFGGVGSSGMGSYHGKHGFLMLSHAKSVLHKSEWFDAPQRYPPYTASNLRFYRLVLNLWRVNQDTFINAGKLLLLAAAVVAVARIGALGSW